MSNDVQDLAEQAGRSQTLEFLARFGYAGSGLVHLLIAWIAGQVALGSSSGEADEAGALEQVGGSPGGAVLLWVCVAGFAALAVWHLIEAVVPHHGPTREQLVDRGKSVGKGIVFGALGWTALQVVTGSGADSGETTTEATATLMSAPAGRFLVGAIGLVVLAVGAYHVYKGVSKKFVQDLQGTGQREVTRAVEVLGVTGYVAKGAALGVVGGLIAVAALQADPDQPTGLDAALKTLSDQPLGGVMLLLVAIGLAAYGLYSFARARYASM
ncbi:DUF1206 domain-containing protein [Ornithinimicrobium faecis]|uniref:DUF1206 domain-containing protein n=1 Tax=Ornithinimicrobium faecis TaxID=2934158 RepID=A0ABY4YPL9_9MICO|nr:DUF1206 domain-containing protein [Ornithinimicrobium sp. HY1793]USQ78557.1 DUF1206 domain-containing protein [Ornithinimicrobium sp. HY1793]